MKKIRTLPSFLKGIRILQDVANHPKGVRLTDISKELDLPSSNVILYLNTLLSAGILIRDPLNRRFFISPMAVELFQKAGDSLIHQLVPCADAPMKHLHEQFNENVLLGFRKENTVYFIKHIRSDHAMGINIDPEPDFPLHGTAAGRAILAFLPEKEINTYLRKATFEKLTSKTISDEKTLTETLEQTRRDGFAFNPGEFEEEIMAVAAPVLIENRPVASLVIQFPTLRHTQEDAKTAAQFIMKQTRMIEKQLQQGTL